MGISAAEFVSADGDAQTLDRRIRPSEEQFDEQRGRWNLLADYLVEDLKARSGHSISTWLQGSYKFGTQIRPASMVHEFDIDLGAYFIWSGEPEDGTFDPAALKQLVQASLSAYAADPDNDVQKVAVPAKAKCSRVHFHDNFHIDVPGYHLDRERDARSLATAANKWEPSDPKAIYLWFKDKFDDQQRALARRLVRYMKMWAALALSEDRRPSSILVTVLVADAVTELDLSALSGDDEVFREVSARVRDRLASDPVVRNPVNSEENLNRLSAEQQEVLNELLNNLVSCADRALSATSTVEAAEIWTEVFAHFFPVPSSTDLLATATSKSVALVSFEPQVAVAATPKNAPTKRFTGLNRIGPIPRDCDIEFRLANFGEVPHGAEVRWTVRNEGSEAERTNDLGHQAGRGFNVTETSAYNGTHFMDVAVHLAGRLIGFRRIPVTIQGPPVPKRNLPRPAYIRLAGRR
jgi:hypothetical protein